VKHQLVPHLGDVPLQKLKRPQIKAWHSALLKDGLHPQTVRNAHGMLANGLELAVEDEILSRNVTRGMELPKVPDEEIEILKTEQITEVLSRIEDHPLHPIAALSLATGMRRGELCALQWGAVNLDKAMVEVRRSMEETDIEGLRLKSPKTKAGRRTISIPPTTVEMLRAHFRKQVELLLQLGIGGRPGAEEFVFTRLDGGGPWPPGNVSTAWWKLLRARGLPPVRFHSLRHTHASALIDGGMDVVAVSKRLGHSKPSITLNAYSHEFDKRRTDDAAVAVIERMFEVKP
jgi:integrase